MAKNSTDRDLFDEEQQMVAMSFGDHIEELRTRLILALLGLLAGVILTILPPLNLGKRIMDSMQNPAKIALAKFYAERAAAKAVEAEAAQTYAPMKARVNADAFAAAVRSIWPELPAPAPGAAGDRAIELPLEISESQFVTEVDRTIVRPNALVSLAPLETVTIWFMVCTVAGLVLASPWVFYQIWAFIAAGLYRHERHYVTKFLPFSLGLFLAGVFLCYFGVLPVTLGFLLQFNLWLSIEPTLRISEWMSFATVLPLVFGIGFQTPLVMLFLARIGIFTADDFRAKRRIAILVIVVAAAILTPGPDVFSQLMLALPMILLYELGIYMVRDTSRQPAATA